MQLFSFANVFYFASTFGNDAVVKVPETAAVSKDLSCF
jgi:hypothetical protein